MNNIIIREAARNQGVKLWEIADRIGLNDGNFSRKLRKELPEEEQKTILRIIDDICAEHNGGSN